MKNIRRFVSTGMWALGALAMVPTFASAAAAQEATATGNDAIPLEGSQCWGRCSMCTTRCTTVSGAERERCQRTCQAVNDRCCEGAGRHGSSRACGCD